MKAMRSVMVLLLSGLVAVTAGACGTRLSHEEVRAASVVQDGGSGSALRPGLRDAGSDTGSGGETGGETGDATGGATGGSTGDAGGGSGDAGGSTSGASGATGDTGVKAPIVVGFIGWLSGTGGSLMQPIRDTFVAWQRSVNARGGINGHPVELLVGDDGGNQARSLSIAKDFVENKGAVVLTFAGSGLAFADYAKSKNVPIVGVTLVGGAWNTNPNLFPPFGAAETTAWGTARNMKFVGATKVGSLFCAESPDCEDGTNRFLRYAKEEGLDVVHSQKFSVLQPDFTSECLQLKGKGAQAVYPLGDDNSTIRMARDCARQDYRPSWVTPTANDAIAKIPEFNGSIALTPAFPWFLRSGGPAIDEYVAALQKYTPRLLTEGVAFVSLAWVSAKLIEKAAANVSDKPTSQELLNGLWSMKGETLGGLLVGRAARTFVRGQPTPETFCMYPTRIVDGKWTAPEGLTPVCR